MGAIKVLPDNLANQIAAGEVVERPASVVKELVENALDAGAARVTVELRFGGRERIVVEDDGAGMDGDDLLLSLERHATSKIKSAADLNAISTLGFRGEALPSIASVSRVTLSSRPSGGGEGRLVRVDGGRFSPVEPCGMASGTRVEVADLFFNVPARRKFLRSPATELTHAVTTLEHYALARPGASFRLLNDGKEVLNLGPCASLRERFFSLFPELPAEEFLEVEHQGPPAEIQGLAGRPERNFSSTRYQFTLVNGRFVRDRLLQHAVSQAYEETHPRGRHPALLLHLILPAGKVDVNVHPTKREIRFVESGAVHDAVARAVRRAIAPGRPESAAAGGWPRYSPWRTEDGGPPPRAAEAQALFSSREVPPLSPEAATLPYAGRSPLRALCQWRDSFILCDGPEGLSIVDQHVAHERVRFEEFRRFLDAPGPRQAFLEPRIYALQRSVCHREEEAAALLAAQGFEAEPFGQGSVAVRSHPAFLSSLEAESLAGELVRDLEETGRTPRSRWKEVLVMRSCRGSVMLRDPLSLEAMQHLLDRLFALGVPLTCPHGRPIVYTLREADILGRFGR